MPLKPVDTAIKITLKQAIDDTDFKTREEALTYDQAGMEVTTVLEKSDGTVTTTAITPTTGGVYDWAHTNQGVYELELPASGGVSYNNDTEGILTVYVYCTGVLPFSSVAYDIVPVKVYNSLIAGSDNLEVDLIQWIGVAPLALSSQRVQTYVAAMANAVLTATAIATDAITAAKIAANAIGSSEFAQAAADKVWDSTTRTLTTLVALEATLTAMKGSGWTDETLKAIKDAIDAIATAAAIAAAVWDEVLANHLTSGSTGRKLSDIPTRVVKL